MEVRTLEGKQKKRWTAVFFASIMILSAICLGIMNAKYDSLSRYPYTDKKSRQLIKEYLNKDEIEYIIEYSIAPNMFIAYIQEDGFNIYHASEYKKLSSYEWQESPGMIVTMVEETRNIMDTDTLAVYLVQYTYEEIHTWILGDTYSPGSTLIKDPQNLDAWLDDTQTASDFVPSVLKPLPEGIPSSGSEVIQVDESLEQPLTDLCKAAETELNQNSCGGLQIESGYVSFETQKDLWQKAEDKYSDQASQYEFYPGHSEHQLGKTVDFGVEGILNESFQKTEQCQWLEENAYRFGFLPTLNEEDESLTGKKAQSWHYRFVGIAIAKEVHDAGTTFAAWKASQTAE